MPKITFGKALIALGLDASYTALLEKLREYPGSARKRAELLQIEIDTA
jgi:hypothetical protein